jgi:RNA polymerase sigma factor (sigma-70 family)
MNYEIREGRRRFRANPSDLSTLQKTVESLSHECLQTPKDYELSRELGKPLENIWNLLRVARGAVSLEECEGYRIDPDRHVVDRWSQLKDDEENRALLGRYTRARNNIPDVEAEDEQQRALEDQERKEGVREILRTLGYREREVIKLRYGLSTEHPWSLGQVANIFNISDERVRMIQLKALRKLRKLSRFKGLEDLL